MSRKHRAFLAILSICILVVIIKSIYPNIFSAEPKELNHEKTDGMLLTQRILEAPGKIFLLSTGEDTQSAKMDLNFDAIPEYISINGYGVSYSEYTTKESLEVPSSKLAGIVLSIGEAVYVYDNAEENIFGNVLAVSPDGEHIYIGLRGSSAETRLPITCLFAYDGKNIKHVFSAYIDIIDETTVIGTEQISAILQVKKPIKNTVNFTWKKNSEGIYREQFEDEYTYLEEAEYELKAMIPLFSAPDWNSVRIAEIGNQNVWFLKTKLDGAKNYSPLSSGIAGDHPSWVFIRTESGVEGWIQVGNRIVSAEGVLLDTSDVLIQTK